MPASLGPSPGYLALQAWACKGVTTKLNPSYQQDPWMGAVTGWQENECCSAVESGGFSMIDMY